MSKKNDLDIHRGKIANAGFHVSDDANSVNCDADRECQNNCLKFKIRSEIDEDSFVRAVWIYLAKMDVPFDVFDCDLDRIETIEHQVMIDTVNVAVEYEAASSKERYGRSVKSECIVKSTACVENGKGKGEVFASEDDSFGLGEEEKSKAIVSFDADAFLECCESMSADSVFLADTCDAEQMKETEDCEREVVEKHDDDILAEIGKDFGGEYHVTWWIAKPLERSARMYMTPERYTTITYNEKVYTMKAFPFGDVKVSGDKIENDHSLRSYVENRQKMYEADKEKVQKSAAKEKNEWSRTLFFVSALLFIFFVAGGLALSLAYAFNGLFTAWNGYSIGMLVGAIVAVVAFVGAVSTFIVDIIRKIGRNRAIDAKACREIEAKQNEAETAIKNFSTTYKARQLEILNEKLEFLGLKPATVEELFE